MSSTFFQQYGVEEARRNRVIRNILVIVGGIVVVAVAAYLLLYDFAEKRVAKQFLSAINSGQYQAAYEAWGCTSQHPCPNYTFNRFMEDWGPSKKPGSPWSIASSDSCRSFLTVNVQAAGTELQSLAIQRNDHSLGFAPSPECQERKWRWKLFFSRIFGGGDSPPAK